MGQSDLTEDGLMDKEGEEKPGEQCSIWYFLGLRKIGTVTGIGKDSSGD